jgi:hypothetical protein
MHLIVLQYFVQAFDCHIRINSDTNPVAMGPRHDPLLTLKIIPKKCFLIK